MTRTVSSVMVSASAPRDLENSSRLEQTGNDTGVFLQFYLADRSPAEWTESFPFDRAKADRV